jgi:hypothetical protein
MKRMIKQKFRDVMQYCWNFLVLVWKYCWDTPYLRFLNVGFVNLLFMYGSGVLLDFLLRNIFPTFFIALLVSIFHVTFSFATRKIYIYKTKGNWLKEYLRCYAFYSVSIVVSVLVLWSLMDAFGFAFWSAQLWSIFVATVFYSLTSRYFAFMRIPEHEEQALIEGDEVSPDQSNKGSDSEKKSASETNESTHTYANPLDSMSEEDKKKFKDIL